MRTTVNIDDELLAAARAQARRRGMTLGRVVEDALRRTLLAPAQDAAPPVLPVFEGGTGPRAGVDPSSNRSLLEALEDGDAHDRLR